MPKEDTMAKMTREEMDRILDEHFEFEARDDVDGVLSTLTEDVEHDVVGSPGSQITGPRERSEVLRIPVSGPQRRVCRVGPPFLRG
jgi:hypothetical protein